MLMELADQDLYDYVHDKKGLTLEQVKPLFEQILEGIAYLHGIGIAHRDIKELNVLMKDGVPKITDFDIACWANDRDPIEKRNKRKGTSKYKAPEMANANIIISDPRPSDIYAAAIMLKEITKGKKLNGEAEDLFKKMTEKDPKLRLTAKECLEHPWLK